MTDLTNHINSSTNDKCSRAHCVIDLLVMMECSLSVLSDT